MKLRSTNENFFHKKRVNLEKWKDSDDAGRYRNRSIEDLENHEVSKGTIGCVINVDFSNSDDGRKFPNGSNGVVLVAELELAALISGFQISNSTSKASSLVGFCPDSL